MPPNYEFKTIYDEYYLKIFLYIKRMVGENDAEDVVQDVFNKVNSGLRSFQGTAKLSTWIYRIATNTAIDKIRSAAYKHSSQHVSIEEDANHEHQAISEDYKPPSTDQIVIQKEMTECINEYLDTLPPDYKTIITLSELEGMTNREVAEILDISVDNVKIRLHRARARLKSILNEVCALYYTDENTLACDRKQVQILPKVPK